MFPNHSAILWQVDTYFWYKLPWGKEVNVLPWLCKIHETGTMSVWFTAIPWASTACGPQSVLSKWVMDEWQHACISVKAEFRANMEVLRRSLPHLFPMYFSLPPLFPVSGKQAHVSSVIREPQMAITMQNHYTFPIVTTISKTGHTTCMPHCGATGTLIIYW